ncbi:MAG: hypothetical protein AAF628_05265 [Planctomycetota bacterium]
MGLTGYPPGAVAHGTGRLLLVLAGGTVSTLFGCQQNADTPPPGAVAGPPLRLAQVHSGNLVDVYGLRPASTGTAIELYQRDLLVGPDIRDERHSGSAEDDEDILYDFIGTDPESRQPRLLITRSVDSTEFAAAVEALDDQLPLVTPAVFGQSTPAAPYSLVARNAAIRLTFDGDLGITDDFFVERDADGAVVGLRNTEAVQLLKIVGDPGTPGTFAPIAARVVPRGRQILIDPVLLGVEGPQYRARNNAAGLPESADQVGANIRLALALDGPLALPGLRADRTGATSGANLGGTRSVIRDFRSGNRNDDTPTVSQGFLRDPVPPRLVGEIRMCLERVDRVDDLTQVLTIYKHGVEHELDRGDVIQLVGVAGNPVVAVTQITSDPIDDRGRPDVQHVRVVVRRVIAADGQGGELDLFEEWDPSGSPDNLFWQQFAGGMPPPPMPSPGRDRDDWLAAQAPLVILEAEFTSERRSAAGDLYGDDPRFFVTFAPKPLPDSSGRPSEPNQNVSPFASAIVRFSKPVDLATLRALDTFFFGTRDLVDPRGVASFIEDRNLDPSTFVHAKYVTPHLVAARLFDEDGSRTSFRLQPSLGFYLDQKMRDADEGRSFEDKQFRYFVHLVGGPNGIKDLSGNRLDFQAEETVRDDVAIPFSLDTRTTGSEPSFEDNRSVTVARRFADPDEDEHPSYYVTQFSSPPWVYPTSYDNYTEVREAGSAPTAASFNLRDVFGAVAYLPDGTLSARPTSRTRQAVDDVNLQSPPPQSSAERWCPAAIGGDEQITSSAAQARFSLPLQNPLNPFGCRLQTVWREIDMNLSKTDPLDFNLDVEQLWWAPFTAGVVSFDEFDRVSLFLGHAERRPEPCVGNRSSLASMQDSGLETVFADNYVLNRDLSGAVAERSQPHPAFLDQTFLIAPADAISDPQRAYRYMPLPRFQRPYFVWRDERLLLQGGDSGVGADTGNPGSGSNRYAPYLLSPFLTGRGRAIREVGAGQGLEAVHGAWDNRRNFRIQANTSRDEVTDGLVGSIALPLLADFWMHPDDPGLPASNPFLAAGTNGWQISLAVTSGAKPDFRVYSAGGIVSGRSRTTQPGSRDWKEAGGGYTPQGRRTLRSDNSFFWVMADYLKRVSVLTNGFVDIVDPHRILQWPPTDPRLGPYFDPFARGARGALPRFDYGFEPPLEELPSGTSVVPEFRGAGIVDAGIASLPGPWAAARGGFPTVPDPINFPLDPRKAGDAHIRKLDDRTFSVLRRSGWTHYYNRNVTTYVADPNQLMDEAFASRFATSTEQFLPHQVRYFNWRLVFTNNIDAAPPVTPRIDSFFVTYRFEDR